jgi:hypothetical protein
VTQLEIKFFWPLTEQTSLDLDYSNCEKPKLTTVTDYNVNSTGFYTLATSNTQWSTYIHIDENNFVVKTNKEIPWYRSLLFKIIGIKLEKNEK